MRRHLPLLILSVTLASAALAEAVHGLKVLPKPKARWTNSSKQFAAWELPFQLPQRLKANALYESEPFYAVVLRREPNPTCDGGEVTRRLERFRRDAQAHFPAQKVFADHQCPDMGAVAYSIEGQAEAEAMVAVYAGTTRLEGQPLLRKAATRYPGARLVRMRASFTRSVQ